MITITALSIVTGALAAANVAKIPHPNSTSAIQQASGTSGFEVYTLERATGTDTKGQKKPDTIRGQNVSPSGPGTVIVSALRIQEYAPLSSGLAVVTLNEDNTGSLEIIPFTGGPPVKVPLPKTGTVEQLHAAAASNRIGFVFTSSPVSDGYWKSLFVYDAARPSTPPREVNGIHGPLPVSDWTFIPGAASIVAQTDDQSMFVLDTFGTRSATPLGHHGQLLGFIPGTKSLTVRDRPPTPGTGTAPAWTIDLATGKTTPLTLPDTGTSPDSTPGKEIPLDTNGRSLQVLSTFTAGKENSVIETTGPTGTRQLFRPAPAMSRILDLCLSPDRQYLSVETAPPEYTGDHYPNLPAWTPMTTEIIDATTGHDTATLPGFLTSWCR